MRTQLFEDANKTHSLFINASINEGDGERKFSKITINIIQRDDNNKVINQVPFFVDYPDAWAWFETLSDSLYQGEIQQYKEFGNKGRGIKIVAKGPNVRISIQEKNNENNEGKVLYFDLSRLKMKEAALICTAFIKEVFHFKFFHLLKGETFE